MKHFNAISVFTALFLGSASSYAALPQAEDDRRSIATNSRLTINVLANDFDADGDPLSLVEVGTPQLGSTQINDDGSILYIPEPDAIGEDSFTYTITDSVEGTATATVFVSVLENIYSEVPADDNTLNFGQSFAGYCSNLRRLNDSEAGPIRREMRLRCEALERLSQQDPNAAAAALRQIAPEETLAILRNALDSGRSQSQAVSQRIAHIKNGGPAISFNGSSLLLQAKNNGAAGDSDTPWAPLGLFVSVQYEESEREQSALENGYDTAGSSVTFGIDYRLSHFPLLSRLAGNSVIGAALGHNRSELRYVDKAGDLATETFSGLLFGSWNGEQWSIDAQLGYSHLNFASRRATRYSDGSGTLVDLIHRGDTRGSQRLFKLESHWQWHRQALSLSPYLRLEAQQNQVEAYEEFGGGGFALGILEQTASQLTLGAGLQASYARNYQWGVLLPTAEIGALSEVHSDRDPALGYFVFDAPSLSGNNSNNNNNNQNPNTLNAFTLQNDGGDRNFYQLGLGTSAQFKRGISGFIQYRQLLGYQYFSAWQLQTGVRFEL